ncbi:hypothetical protein E3N88_12976 [Mikania micrantha]|uniref:Myb/SANT-like domain-containing protein n=1 Tax=Mikania micrantha TaxID=192012 RepID=A0A5N6P9J3_9ASTR|nr:hypothetical protein E3N88_12976 [Mikania micrantha]
MATKRSRISWKQEGVEKTFLESCVNELTLHGREWGSLKALSWKKVAEKLQSEHGFVADQKQMKNRKFSVWTKLKNKTGNSNKHAEALRSAPLAYPDLCVQLFEGATSNGFDSWGPSSTRPHPFEDISEHNLNDFEDIECTQMDPPHKVVSEESSGHSKKELKKRKAKETINSQIMEVGEHIMNLAKMLIENQKSSNDMEACMTKLGTMGWDESDMHYDDEIVVFILLCYYWLQLVSIRDERIQDLNSALIGIRVIACFAVHNFLRQCNIHDLLFMEYNENSMFAETQPQGEPSEGHSIHDIEWGSQSNEYMNSLRNHIASHLA